MRLSYHTRPCRAESRARGQSGGAAQNTHTLETRPDGRLRTLCLAVNSRMMDKGALGKARLEAPPSCWACRAADPRFAPPEAKPITYYLPEPPEGESHHHEEAAE